MRNASVAQGMQPASRGKGHELAITIWCRARKRCMRQTPTCSYLTCCDFQRDTCAASKIHVRNVVKPLARIAIGQAHAVDEQAGGPGGGVASWPGQII